ncbi:hypothetical protein X777_00514 [Ooceraea biroi]|uniref:DUF4817 domain-containing protein n=1 Tax=Ooceraea biroi TaxID=2015173 RepID=A0A026WTM5_OOCBI|nr:hypothetical protein X777_00514 [Ooceraea biroi]
MPKVFSNEEYTDIHFVYGFCDGNARAAVREYQRRFPNRRVPDRFKYIYINLTEILMLTLQRLKKTESFNMVSRADKVFEPLKTKRIIGIIFQQFNQNPSISTRMPVSELGISSTII